MSADKTIEAAQEFIGQDLDFSRLDQTYDHQRLLGPVIAFKVLLELIVNSADDKVRLNAASQVLQHAKESPERVVERLRASVFQNLTLEQLEAVVQTGITDPAQAVARLRAVKEKESAGG